MVSKEEVLGALKRCYDPEIPVNIVDLGLVYGLDIQGEKVNIRMTLTAPGCPMHSTISENVKREVEKLDGVGEADVEMVWEPPWSVERMSPRAKKKLGVER